MFRIVSAVAFFFIATATLAVAADRGFDMKISDVVRSFNDQAKLRSWDIRIVQEGCSKSNEHYACNYYISDGIVAISNALDDGKTLKNFSIFFNSDGDKTNLTRSMALAMRMLAPEADDPELKATIHSLFTGVAASADDEAKADLHGVHIRALIPGKLGLFAVVFSRP
jgi:hypothetical protein